MNTPSYLLQTGQYLVQCVVGILVQRLYRDIFWLYNVPDVSTLLCVICYTCISSYEVNLHLFINVGKYRVQLRLYLSV